MTLTAKYQYFHIQEITYIYELDEFEEKYDMIAKNINNAIENIINSNRTHIELYSYIMRELDIVRRSNKIT